MLCFSSVLFCAVYSSHMVGECLIIRSRSVWPALRGVQSSPIPGRRVTTDTGIPPWILTSGTLSVMDLEMNFARVGMNEMGAGYKFRLLYWNETNGKIELFVTEAEYTMVKVLSYQIHPR